MKSFKLLGLLILSCGIFLARGATGEDGVVRPDYESLSLPELEKKLRFLIIGDPDRRMLLDIIEKKEREQGIVRPDRKMPNYQDLSLDQLKRMLDTIQEDKFPFDYDVVQLLIAQKEAVERATGSDGAEAVMIADTGNSGNDKVPALTLAADPAAIQALRPDYASFSLQELKHIFETIAIGHPDWRMLLDLIEKKERELGIVKSENPGAGAALPQTSQTLIIYSDGSTKVFNNNQLQKLLFFHGALDFNERLAHQKQYVDLGKLFENGEDLNGLFDFVVELANATAETIDGLRARLSRYSFTDLVKIAQMLDILTLDNDIFNIEQLIADLLFQKFKIMQNDEKKIFNISSIPQLFCLKKTSGLALSAIVENTKQVVFNTDETIAAFLSNKNNLSFYNLENMSLIGPIIENVNNVFFSPDKVTVGYIKNDYRLCFFKLFKNEIQELIIDLDLDNVLTVIFNNNGSGAIIFFLDGKCLFLNMETLQEVSQLENFSNVISSCTKKLIALIQNNGVCNFFNGANFRPIGNVINNVKTLVFSPDESLVAVLYFDNRCDVFETVHFRLIHNFNNVRKMDFSSNGLVFTALHTNNECDFFNTIDFRQIGNSLLNVQEVVLNDDGNIAVIINSTQDCIIVSLSNLTSENNFVALSGILPFVKQVVFTSSVNLMIRETSECRLLNVLNLEQIGKIEGFFIGIKKKGQFLILQDTNHDYRLLDERDFRLLASFSNIESITFSPSNEKIVLINKKNECFLYQKEYLLFSLSKEQQYAIELNKRQEARETESEAMERIAQELAEEEWREQMRRKKSVNSACTIS